MLITRKDLDVHDFAMLAVRQAQARVFHLAAFSPKMARKSFSSGESSFSPLA